MAKRWLFLLNLFSAWIATSYTILPLAAMPFNSCYAQQAGSELNIIPQPVSMRLNGQVFKLNNATVIYLGKGVNPDNLVFFNQYLRSSIHAELKISGTIGLSKLVLQLDSTVAPHSEGYNLVVNHTNITLSGHDEAGIFYGLQTLIQLMKKAPDNVLNIEGCEIADYPRFAYRGMHLDVSRHLCPVTAIKKWINLLALYKINTFHWHLTDDQGWRIEIKKYPKLQSVAAYRSQTLIGHKKELPHIFDKKRYGGFYTQQEARDIVKYAADRHITVIPEIEMPGHACAALAAYPFLGCTGGPYQTANFWGVFDDVYCAGNDETFNFLENVLDEIITIFPSKYIHIGGDECPKKRWEACLKCRQRINDEHLKDEHALQSYFINRIARYLETKNRQVIGWDELLEGGLTPGMIVMSWTGEDGGTEAARQHHNVIMTPEKYVYLDYYQSLNANEPLAAGGYTPLSKIYNYDPVPCALNTQDIQYFLGVQANVWSEYLPDANKAEYMIFPRILALSEIAWTPKRSRNYGYFLKRVRANETILKKLHINYANIFDEITDTISKSASGLPLLALKTSFPGAVIRYTINGSKPSVNSQPYTQPILITKTCRLRAGIFFHKNLKLRLYSKNFNINKATGKNVMLAEPASGNYHPSDIFTIVNGVAGSNRYNDGEWFGFNGNNLDAVIDLESLQTVKSIGTHLLNYHWQKMWPPISLSFEVSVDGKTYRQVYKQDDFPVNGINTIKANIHPVKVRYLKIRGINKGLIPLGKYGAGSKAWLLTDEFIVN